MKYDFCKNLTKEEYTDFYNKMHGNFMQSYEWGEFKKESSNYMPHYLGLKNNNELVCACLLLEQKERFGFKYFYSPRGYIMDYNNKELLEVFTNHLKKFIKDNKGIYLKIDPEIEYQEIDEQANKKEDGYNNYEIFNNLLELGYKHSGFNLGFELDQPRFTFVIDTTPSVEELQKNIDKSIMKKINKTFEYDMILTETNNVHTFYKLIQNNCDKDNFITFYESYFQKAIDLMNGMYKCFELSINPKHLIQKLKDKIKEEETKIEEYKEKNKSTTNIEDSIKRSNKMIEELNEFKDEDRLVICSQVVGLSNDKMYLLYIGNAQIGQNMHAVNRMYYEMIMYAKNNNIKYLDLYGTTGNPNSKDAHLLGIHNYKKNFGGKYIEFIGEFNLIVNKPKLVLLKIYTYFFRKLYTIRERIRSKKEM